MGIATCRLPGIVCCSTVPCHIQATDLAVLRRLVAGPRFAAPDDLKVSRPPRFTKKNRHQIAQNANPAVDKSGRCKMRIRAGKIRIQGWNLVTRLGAGGVIESATHRAPKSPFPTLPLAISSMRSKLRFAFTRNSSSSSMRGCKSRSARYSFSIVFSAI